ncbi:MAG: helix-turn-helix domain-containing protein [Chloroflexota bacterium]
MIDPYWQLGQRVRLLRRQRGMTQAQLAERVGVSDNFIGMIERGRGHPTLETVNRVATALETEMRDLFQGAEHPGSTEEVLEELNQLLEGRPVDQVELVLAIAKTVLVRGPVRKSVERPRQGP